MSDKYNGMSKEYLKFLDDVSKLGIGFSSMKDSDEGLEFKRMDTKKTIRDPDFQGKKNIYTCDTCHKHVVTVDKDQGVTPFMIQCKSTHGCKGSMQSSFYRVFDQTMLPDFEWYKPTSAQQLTLGERDHVNKGGLLIRKYVDV